MEKFKDFFYDKNDIVVALIIIAVAALIINGRVNAIMDYPEVLAAELAQEQNQPVDKIQDPGDDVTTPDGIQNNTPEQTPPPVTPVPNPTTPVVTPPTPPANTDGITCVIPSGANSDKIAQILVDAGVVSSKDDFISAAKAANADTKLKAGTFRIPAGASLADIVAIISK